MIANMIMASRLWIPQEDIKSETTTRVVLGRLLVSHYNTHVSPTALWQVGEVVAALYYPESAESVCANIGHELRTSCATTLREYMVVQSDNGAVQLSTATLKSLYSPPLYFHYSTLLVYSVG
jgi:hypothetical protein